MAQVKYLAFHPAEYCTLTDSGVAEGLPSSQQFLYLVLQVF